MEVPGAPASDSPVACWGHSFLGRRCPGCAWLGAWQPGPFLAAALRGSARAWERGEVWVSGGPPFHGRATGVRRRRCSRCRRCRRSGPLRRSWGRAFCGCGSGVWGASRGPALGTMCERDWTYTRQWPRTGVKGACPPLSPRAPLICSVCARDLYEAVSLPDGWGFPAHPARSVAAQG